MTQLLHQIKRLIELESVDEANEYLDLGWTLLGVHERIRLQVGMTRSLTVYVLGHTRDKPPSPYVPDDFDFEIEE